MGVTRMKSLPLKLGIVFLGLSILGSGHAWGADWKFFSSTDSYEVSYYVSQSHLLYKTTIRLWVKLEYTEKGKADYIKQFGKDYKNLSYSLQYWEIDCPSRRQRVLSINHYNAEGDVLNTEPAKNPFSKSFTMSLVETICK